MNTRTNIAWYYVGVMGLLLAGQNYVLTTSHKDQMAKVQARLAAATGTPETVAAVPPPASTLSSALAGSTSHGVPEATSSAAPAVKQAAAVPATEQKPIAASAAPSMGSRAKSKSSSTPLPVAFQFRSEPFQAGKVVTLTNTSAQKLDCTVRVKRLATGESRSIAVTIGAAGEVRLMRSIQGWDFKTGDLIEVTQPGYKSRSASVP